MNSLHTAVTIAPKHSEAAVVMSINGRVRVRHISLYESMETVQKLIQSHEIQFLRDIGANGRVLRKGTLSLLSDQRRKRNVLPVARRTMKQQPNCVTVWLQAHPGTIIPDTPSEVRNLTGCSIDAARWYLKKRRYYRVRLRQRLSKIETDLLPLLA